MASFLDIQQVGKIARWRRCHKQRQRTGTFAPHAGKLSVAPLMRTKAGTLSAKLNTPQSVVTAIPAISGIPK
jgi:hypothetical protein